MTMTAISKGLQRVMKLLYEYDNRQECNKELKIMWTNEYEVAKSGHQNDENLSKFLLYWNYCILNSRYSAYSVSSIYIYTMYNYLFMYTDYHMKKLLKQLSLEKYWPVFDKQNIDYNDFLKLSEQDLKDIGIKSVYIQSLIS